MGDGELTMREAGRQGGRAFVARHGREHLVALGRKGGRNGAPALHATYCPLPGLARARIQAGLTQNELARLAGLTNGSHVGRIERGVGMAAPKTVARLARALGVEEAVLRRG